MPVFVAGLDGAVARDMESPVFVQQAPPRHQSMPKLVSKRRCLNLQPGTPAHQRKDTPETQLDFADAGAVLKAPRWIATLNWRRD